MTVGITIDERFFPEYARLDRRGSCLAGPKLTFGFRSQNSSDRRIQYWLDDMQNLFTRQQIEIIGNLFDDLPADDLFAFGISGEHRVVAKIVDVARNPFRALVDKINRARREDLRLTRACDH